MTADTFDRWRAAAIRGYADDKIRVGAWPAADALVRSSASSRSCCPTDRPQPATSFARSSTRPVRSSGRCGSDRSPAWASDTCFIWDIEVAPEARGLGHGRAALQALEPIARELGYDAIALHVFADNEVARNLYRSSGYVETDVSMRKPLG